MLGLSISWSRGIVRLTQTGLAFNEHENRYAWNCRGYVVVVCPTPGGLVRSSPLKQEPRGLMRPMGIQVKYLALNPSFCDHCSQSDQQLLVPTQWLF